MTAKEPRPTVDIFCQVIRDIVAEQKVTHPHDVMTVILGAAEIIYAWEEAK